MTCIVAIERAGKVYMGGDSAAAEGWNIRATTTPKVFRKGELLIGYTWSFRMGQAIQYAQAMPEIPAHMSDYEYLVTDFVAYIRDTLQCAGFLKIENSREEGGEFLVGIHGGIYRICSDFSVLRCVDGFDSVGCGSPYALGALAVLDNSKHTPMDILKIALLTAARFSNGVQRPFILEETP